MSWSAQMRAARRARGGQIDMFDSAALSYKLVCDGAATLTNRMVVARKRHACEICAGPINPGDRIRAESRRSADGKSILTRRACPACCAAAAAYVMAAAPGPNPGAASERAAIDARHGMGAAARKAVA